MKLNALIAILAAAAVLPMQANAQTTTISTLSPSSARAGSPATPLAVTGQNIASGSTVAWTTPDGRKVTIPASLVTAAQLAATIPATLLSTAGTAQVALVNGSGVLSNQLPFTIGSAGITIAFVPSTVTPSVAGSAYFEQFVASGGTGSYAWSVAAGSLPAGLSLDPVAGTLTGTPQSAGTFAFGLKATDGTGANGVASFTVSIAPAALTITNAATLPAGVAGFDYPAQILTAAGGTAPYTFALASGALPGGLTLSSGQIAGTPSTAGTYSFTLQVTDSSATPLSTTVATQIVVKATQALPVLGSTTANFAITTGSTGLPAPLVIPVVSSVPAQLLQFTTAVTPAAPWLTVTASASTPGTVSLALNTAALALAASATPYQTSVILTCAASLPCSSSPQTIAVSLSVTSPPAQLNVTTTQLSFTGSSTAAAGVNQGLTQTLNLRNSGAGTLTLTSIAAADSWLTVGTYPATLAGGPGIGVAITATPGSLGAGFYQSSITVISSAGRATVPVNLFLTANADMTLAPAGALFTLPAGGALGNNAGTFGVGISSAGSTPFTAAVQPGASWLSIASGTGTAQGPFSGAVKYTLDPVAAAALAQGTYYGSIRVTAAGVLNSPQDFVVVLNVTAPGSAVLPDPQPQGLLFFPTAGVAPSPQTVTLYASAKTAVPYQASATTSDGHSWLSVTPSSGTTSASSAAATNVSVNLSGLAAGVYRGTVNYSYAGSAVSGVNVTLIVPPGATTGTSGIGLLSEKSAATCAPTQLVPAQTSLVNSFSAVAAWPVALAIQLADNCGNSVTNGQVIASFTNNDPQLVLTPASSSSGLYTGTWTPRGTGAAVTIGVTASAPNFPTATASFAGAVKPGVAPLLAAGGVLNVFEGSAGPVGPGTIVQIYGSGLTSVTTTPSTLPLPTASGGTQVVIGGVAAPLFYVSSGQINAQVPFELAPSQQYQVLVYANQALSTPQSITVTGAAPGVLTYPATGVTVAIHQDGSLVSTASPATAGEYLQIYVAGMGLTDSSAVVSGAASPGVGSALANVLAKPTVTLAGEPVNVLFAGLTPTLVGLYQVNFQVPADAKSGNLTLVVSQPAGATAPASASTTILPIL